MKFIYSLFSLNLFILLVQSASLNQVSSTDQNDDPIARNKECKYEKEPWSECDLASGLQKRILKLKANLQDTSVCEQTKIFTRQCKKACRYNKGTWSNCENGEKSRVDSLKRIDQQSASDCEPTRTTKKRCKQPSNCKYSKSEWSPCENGQKSKTLILEQGDQKECEERKTITKQCNQNKKNKSRKKTKKDRNDNKKQDLITTSEESKDLIKESFEEAKEE